MTAHEIELKYSVAELAALESFLDEHFPAPAGDAGWRDYTTLDRFFDTADGRLLQAGYGARLRSVGGEVTLGLKADVSVAGGLHHRLEFESPAGARLRPAEWAPSEARDIVLRLATDKPLRERFVLRQSRREREWRAADGSGSCVFSLDDVAVRRGHDELGSLRGLEVELRSSDAAVLERIDKTISGSGLVRHEARSKMALAAGMARAAAPIRADEPFAEAGRRVLRRHLERMLEREAAVRAGDRQALKQMRVATRRMRATWRLFDGAFASKPARRYVGELRHVARRLGRVRDLDVLLEALPRDPALAPLADAWRQQRERAWAKLLRFVDSARYAGFIADYRSFTEEDDGGADGPQAALRLKDVAASRVWAAYERVRAYEPALADADVASLHALRIDGKRLRYALETFGPLLGRTAADDLLAPLVALQDHLGALNDARLAASMAGEWSDSPGDGASRHARRAAKDLAVSRAEEVEALRARVRRRWRAIGGAEFRRSLAGALAAL